MATEFLFDVFVSYSAKDRATVRRIVDRLQTSNLRVWFDELIIQPGDLIGLRIEQGLDQSRTLLLMMSSNAFSSEWSTLERHTVLFRDPTNSQRRFVPVRLDDGQIPDTLKQFAYVDLRQHAEEEYERLIKACQAPAEGIIDRETVLKGQALKGSPSGIGVALTRDGRWAVSGSRAGIVRVWNLDTQQEASKFNASESTTVPGVAITDDGKLVVFGSHDGLVRFWKRGSRRVRTLRGHTLEVIGVAVTPTGGIALSASWDRTVRVWDVRLARCIHVLKGHSGHVIRVAVTADGRLAISGSADRTIRLWDLSTGACVGVLEGHTATVVGVAITPDGRRAVSGSEDKTVRVWDVEALKCVATLEGHLGKVEGVGITEDGRRAISASQDRTLKVWQVNSGRCIATLAGHSDEVRSVAITPDGRRAVSIGPEDYIQLWNLPPEEADAQEDMVTNRYTNAKVLLVGESGVGKTGLAIRLTLGRFEATVSSDGVWATQMKLPHDMSGREIEREIWLWDFAGQADYRLIHQLFMDETALAILVFNPQSEDPFEGLSHWDRDLTRAARRPFRKLLVAGRCDRGGLMVSRHSVERFRLQSGFDVYLETSAKTGAGCEDLRRSIIENINWGEIPWTASPRIFRLLKEAILQLRDRGKVLLRLAELKQQLEMELPGEVFTIDQLRAVMGLLAGPGIVWQLEFGDFVLLNAEYINAYAAAVIRSVRAHTDEIGCITEERVLGGDIDYQDMRRLPQDEEQIVLRAMHQIFVEHGLCLREPTEAGTLLVFPSYFKRERPELQGHPMPLVTYRFRGALEEIYATLVVRLHYTLAFDHDQLWRFAADFKTQEGKRLGLKMQKRADGSASLTVFLDPGIPEDTRVTFIRYIHDHLKSKDPNMVRARHYVCPHCQAPVENQQAVENRLSSGLEDIICVICEKRVPLFDLVESKFSSDRLRRRVREMNERATSKIDNESRELILLGHAMAIAGEAGQIFRPVTIGDWGIDGEIEFKDYEGKASGERVYLQLKSGDSYLYQRERDAIEVFEIKHPRHAKYWQQHAYPVMLVIRTSDGVIRWMDVTRYLQEHTAPGKKPPRQIVFRGQPFTAINLQQYRDALLQRAEKHQHRPRELSI